MAQWQAALGAGLSSAGDAVFDFYNMKRNKELQEKDEAFRQEQLALQRSLGEGEMQRGMETLSLQQQGLRADEAENARRAAHDANMMGIEQMKLGREGLESDRLFGENQRQFDISEDRMGRVADATAGYYQDLVGARRDADRLRGLQTQLETVSKGIEAQRKQAMDAIGENIFAKTNVDPQFALKQLDEYLTQNNPQYTQQLQLRDQLMRELYSSLDASPESIALMQSLQDAGAIQPPPPVVGGPQGPVVPGGGGLLPRR